MRYDEEIPFGLGSGIYYQYLRRGDGCRLQKRTDKPIDFVKVGGRWVRADPTKSEPALQKQSRKQRRLGKL